VFTRNVGDPVRVEYDGVLVVLFAPDGVVRSIASGTSDASSRGEPPTLSRGDLEHGADVWSREEHMVWREANDADDAVIAVQEHRVDGEPHPERVNRTSVFQQESLVRVDSRSSEETARTLPSRFRDPHHP
jgi:hypothetical protein